MRIARSRYFGSMYFSHKSGGSRMCPSASMTSASAGIFSLPLSTICSTDFRPRFESENRDRIDRRAGPAFKDQRRHREHELIARMLLALFRERIEVRVVDQVDALHHQRADVHRQHQALVAARHHVADAVGAEHRDLALMEPRKAARIEAGQSLREIPCAFGLAMRRASGAYQQNVTLFDVDAVIFLRRVEVLRENRLAVGEPVDFLDLRNIEQHAATDDAGAGHVDGALARAMGSDLARIEAVVHLLFPEH